MPARPVRDTDAPPSPALLTVDPLDPLPQRLAPPAVAAAVAEVVRAVQAA